jgi:signal transduction histidine kinase
VPLRIEAAAGLHVQANDALLETALLNLAENAAKHTAAGEVVLAAAVRDGTLALEVRDTGPGLSREVAERAFDRFYRGGARTADGFGLGLSIVRQAAEALGAQLALEPRRGGGTIARLTLPAAQSRSM